VISYNFSKYLQEPKNNTNTSKWATGKTTKKGERYFTRSLILLRIVGPNGITMIIDWEPINTDDGSAKEDCEQNSAKRLLERFENNFKRLKCILIADALYTNQTFIKIAEKFDIPYIYTLKDESLKKLWGEMRLSTNQENENINSSLISLENMKLCKKTIVPNKNGKSDKIHSEYQWITDLSHAGSSLNWCCLAETVNDSNEMFYFSIITNLPANKETIVQIMNLARKRNMVEDGFNTLKNRGFKLKHRYSRNSDNAAQNYITLMGIADIITNIVMLSDWVQRTYFSLDPKESVQALIDSMNSKFESDLDTNSISKYRRHIPSITMYTMPMQW